ncbi:MAG: sulfatase, partial [Thermoplasmata archaeon]
MLLISIDTLRADHLGCYGYGRPTTPALDRIASEGVLFEWAFAPSPWTLPSHASLMTGTHPSTHGAVDIIDRLSDDAPTVAGAFRAAGYRTAGFVNSGFLLPKFGIGNGFEEYRQTTSVKRGTRRIVKTAVDWLRRNGDRPFFLFVHTYEPHVPYIDARFAEGSPPGRVGAIFDLDLRSSIWEGKFTPTEEEKSYIRALYDGDIAFADEELGRLFKWLEGVGWLDRMIIAVVSDHG